MWLLWTSLSFGAPSWGEIVERAASPIDARWTDAEALEHWQAVCAGGKEAACQLVAGEGRLQVLEAACTEGDGLACVGHAWLTEKSEPEEAFAAYTTQCEAGQPRACAEVARAFSEGIGTYQSRREARRQAEPLCEDGVGAACAVIAALDKNNRPKRSRTLYKRAFESGMAGASERLIDSSPETQVTPLRAAACEAGMAQPCIDLAETVLDDMDRARGLIERACDLGSGEGCIQHILVGRDAQTMGKAEAEARLGELCSDYPEACVQAGFLHFGGEVTAFFPGFYPETENQRIAGQIVPFARDCYRDMVDRNPGWPSETSTQLELWLSAEGVVMGVNPLTDADEDYKLCIVEHSLGIETREPQGGRARVSFDVNLGMEADVVITTFKGASGTEQTDALEELAWEEWTTLANACYIDHGGSAWDQVFTWIYGDLLRDGTFEGTQLVESSQDKDTDACLLALLQDVDLKARYPYNERIRVYMRFNVVYRMPRSRGRYYGVAADPDTYMYKGLPPPITP